MLPYHNKDEFVRKILVPRMRNLKTLRLEKTYIFYEIEKLTLKTLVKIKFEKELILGQRISKYSDIVKLTKFEGNREKESIVKNINQFANELYYESMGYDSSPEIEEQDYIIKWKPIKPLMDGEDIYTCGGLNSELLSLYASGNLRDDLFKLVSFSGKTLCVVHSQDGLQSASEIKKLLMSFNEVQKNEVSRIELCIFSDKWKLKKLLTDRKSILIFVADKKIFSSIQFFIQVMQLNEMEFQNFAERTVLLYSKDLSDSQFDYRMKKNRLRFDEWFKENTENSKKIKPNDLTDCDFFIDKFKFINNASFEDVYDKIFVLNFYLKGCVKSLDYKPDYNSQTDPFKPDIKLPVLQRIEYKDFRNLYVTDISDESLNYHTKQMIDWMTFKFFVNLEKEVASKKNSLPQTVKLSLLSRGNTALSFQTLLNIKEKYLWERYNKKFVLTVLMPSKTHKSIVNTLKKIGCSVKVHVDNLEKFLSSKQIKNLVYPGESNVIDFSDRTIFDTKDFKYFDYLAYFLLSKNFNHYFCPFGNGQIYRNLLSINKKELDNRFLKKTHDIRYKGADPNILCLSNFYGATSNSPKSKFRELYRSDDSSYNQHISHNNYIDDKYCGKESKIYHSADEFYDEAVQITKQNKIVLGIKGLAALALFIQLSRNINNSDKIVIINTGKSEFE